MTNQQISLTNIGQDAKHALGEQQAMAKAGKPGNQNADIGSDPIGAALKEMHDAVVKEALPDDFLSLLDQIDSKIAANKAKH